MVFSSLSQRYISHVSTIPLIQYSRQFIGEVKMLKIKQYGQFFTALKQETINQEEMVVLMCQ